MHARLIVSFLLIFIQSLTFVGSSIPVSTIISDAAEINQLNEELKYNLPWSFWQVQSATCVLINECCPRVKQNLSDYVNLGLIRMNILVQNCSEDPQPNIDYQMCSIFEEFTTAAQEPDVQKLADTLNSSKNGILNIQLDIPSVCSAEEAYAVFCDWTQPEMIQSCEYKRLAYVAEHLDEKEYGIFVEQSKNQTQFIINTIHRVFPSKNSTESEASSSSTIVQTNFILAVYSFMLYNQNLF